MIAIKMDRREFLNACELECMCPEGPTEQKFILDVEGDLYGIDSCTTCAGTLKVTHIMSKEEP